ncbi:type 4b pilus protein PilO2 [Actimicrobium sp. CCI2.3]|uniref:type 4b pilus protein PilO2 n=1 Tax=Actimicrobium sp. CCI2.3 TaxID=3048616 RepID=UPI003A0FF18D
MCAFKLPDDFWAYCAVRDANFLPNGDFAGTREEVLDRLQGDYALGGWNVVIGEPELEQYGFHNFNAKTLDSLLPKHKNGHLHTRSWSSLRPVKTTIPPGFAIAAAGAGTLIFAACVGLYFFRQHQQREQEKELAIAAARARLSAASARQSDERPWLAKPLAIDFARACLAKLAPLTAGGWQLDKFQCQTNKVDYSWTSNGANVRYLLEKIPTAVVAVSGTQATSTDVIAPKTTGKDILLPADIILRNLLEISQSIGVTLKLTPGAPVVAPPAPVSPGAGSVPAPKIEWKTYTLSADLGMLTPLMASTLIGQRGVRLDSISWNSGNWLIEGVVYAK